MFSASHVVLPHVQLLVGMRANDQACLWREPRPPMMVPFLWGRVRFSDLSSPLTCKPEHPVVCFHRGLDGTAVTREIRTVLSAWGRSSRQSTAGVPPVQGEGLTHCGLRSGLPCDFGGCQCHLCAGLTGPLLWSGWDCRNPSLPALELPGGCLWPGGRSARQPGCAVLSGLIPAGREPASFLEGLCSLGACV